MPLQRRIAKAIGAHAIWKVRLQHAIERGGAGLDIAAVGRDDACAFGHWLHGPTMSAEMRAGDDYAAVVRLHAEFHLRAAGVLMAVAAGETERAKAMLTPEGDYGAVSSQLVAAMVRWKQAIEPEETT